MLIRTLRVVGWRNLAPCSLPLGPRVTVLSGRNGQGKSNLLEAAYYAITFRSFRTTSSADVVSWGAQTAEVEAAITLRGLERSLRVRVGVGRKSASLDGKVVRRDAEGLDGAGVVIFGPEDLRLPKGPAAERRKAIDRAVFAVRRSYYREALDYERALKSRNRLLRSGQVERSLLESYDEALARTGARIVARRRSLVETLAPRFARAFSEIHGLPAGALGYRSDSRVEAASGEGALEGALREGLAAHRAVDQLRGFTGFGPHTDDLEILLGERPAREHGSQGQLRSLVLAFKLAELAAIEDENRETPVLLLDDVASELDEDRRGRLFGALASTTNQTLLTVTEGRLLPELPGRADWQVEGGVLRAL